MPLLMRRMMSALMTLAVVLPGVPAWGQEIAVESPVELRRFAATEARQGVAADEHYVYVNSNSAIGKYDKRTGARVGQWSGDPSLFIHMNSCALAKAELVCAASNYPAVPMASSIEIFDPDTLRHVRSRSLGPGRGSLTWLDWHDGSWWAVFAHYDARGGEPGRDHRWTVLVQYDDMFAERGAWFFPATILERFAPYSSSGGAWGPDGLLYVTGHDRSEAYAVRVPEAGSTLVHVGTVPMATGGQAVDWDPVEKRVIWSIDRSRSEVVAAHVPVLEATGQ